MFARAIVESAVFHLESEVHLDRKHVAELLQAALIFLEEPANPAEPCILLGYERLKKQ